MSLTILNLVAPKVGAKNELLLNKLTSELLFNEKGSVTLLKISLIQTF